VSGESGVPFSPQVTSSAWSWPPLCARTATRTVATGTRSTARARGPTASSTSCMARSTALRVTSHLSRPADCEYFAVSTCSSSSSLCQDCPIHKEDVWAKEVTKLRQNCFACARFAGYRVASPGVFLQEDADSCIFGTGRNV
jgi:hypothetical protein